MVTLHTKFVPMKILIVEDEPSLREVIRSYLEKERYVVELAPDYRTARQKAADYDYDCILLDVMLPDGNGLELLEELRHEGKPGNVIVISARDALEDKVTGLEQPDPPQPPTGQLRNPIRQSDDRTVPFRGSRRRHPLGPQP